jgi:lipopolysaccharide transport system ATP-binding protein
MNTDSAAPIAPSEAAVVVEDVSKLYRLGTREDSSDGDLGATLARWARAPFTNWRQLRDLTEFADAADPADLEREERADLLWALRGVSFSVRHGDVLGIVGGNGAGKSTLLKILARITRPSRGRVVLHGKVASLLEVGTGFHPDLSGRENVFLNGTILGMSRREVASKFDEIIEFSQMAPYIDTPVKKYSSGQRVRLAFAVAAHLEPDILLVDEVLAVGDVEFQRKCVGKMKDVASHGRTVLFVSHNIASIRALCDTGIFLKQGRLMHHGGVEEAIKAYLGGLSSGAAVWEAPGFDLAAALEGRLEGIGAGPVELLRVAVVDAEGRAVEREAYDSQVAVEFIARFPQAVEGVYFEVRIHDNNKSTVYFSRDCPDLARVPVRGAGLARFRLRVPCPLLIPGDYTVSVRACGEMAGLPAVEFVSTFELFDNNSIYARTNLPWRGKVAAEIPWTVRYGG